MPRWTRLVCASGLIGVLLAGCASTDFKGFLALQSQSAGRDRVITGSVEAVAQSAQTTLGQMGLAATLSRKGEAIHIASKTASGAKFTLVLNREKTKDGEQTRAHIEWEGGTEDQVGFQMLAQLEALHRH